MDEEFDSLVSEVVKEEGLMPVNVKTGPASHVDFFENNELDGESDTITGAREAAAKVNKSAKLNDDVVDYEQLEEVDGDVEYVEFEEDQEIEALEETAEEEDIAEEQQQQVERKPTQVPKKRKDAALAASVENEELSELITPSSADMSTTAKEDHVDEEQCRVCTTKVELVSLFKCLERQTIAEMLTTICPSVSIAPKDYMPQYICESCLERVHIALQLKSQCEMTERELRKHLSRGKNKVRRPAGGYVVIDAPLESEEEEEEDVDGASDDAEFKISDEMSLSVEDDSADSDFSIKRKPMKKTGTGRRGRPRKQAGANHRLQLSKATLNRREPNKRSAAESTDDDHGGAATVAKRKKDETLDHFSCDECEQSFNKKISLIMHQRSHTGNRQPIDCEICGKQFKIQGAYRTHMAKHKNNELQVFECRQCQKVFTLQAELFRHMARDHEQTPALLRCKRCDRAFVTEARLRQHESGQHCKGHPRKLTSRSGDHEPPVGNDLFKTVAPLTTTYWSDSFSD